jgi:hypothetical protein
MDAAPRVAIRIGAGTPLQLARHYQDLAHRHPDEERFWLCRASYFGRVSMWPSGRSEHGGDRQ